MSDDFIVNNPGMDEVNLDLRGAALTVGQILDRVNQVMNQTSAATQNSGLPLYDDLRTKWNKAYQDMVHRLETGQVSTLEAHDLYKQGDQQVVRIMS